MRSWQEDGGAEGIQQSLHCVYSMCLKHEAKPFLYGLADVQHFDHGDCCYRETRHPRKGSRTNPLQFLLRQCTRPPQPCRSSTAAHKSVVQKHEDASVSKRKLLLENCSRLFCRSLSLRACPAPQLHSLFPNTCDVPCLATALSRLPEGRRG